MIRRRSSSFSASKTMISSMRLMNSGLKVRFTSPSTMSVTLLSIAPESGGLEPHRALLLDEARADVRRHDDDRVLEVDTIAETVGEVAVFEHLQQDVEDVGMRLLDFVEQHDRVRVPLHLLGELTALFVPDIAGRRADQLRDRVLLHVLRHVEADQRVVAAEQEIGQRSRQFGLADAGRTEEHEAADRPVRILQAGARAPDRAGDRRDRLLLADHAAVQLALPCAAACRPRPG